MYDLDFSFSSIFHQIWAHIRHFQAKKVQLIFHLVFALFSLPGRLPKAVIIQWKCLLRVPWWNTFQWGPKKPPKPFLAKKNSSPKVSNHTPSPLCNVQTFRATNGIMNFGKMYVLNVENVFWAHFANVPLVAIFGSNPVWVKLLVWMGLQAGMLGLFLSFTYGKLWPKLKT